MSYFNADFNQKRLGCVVATLPSNDGVRVSVTESRNNPTKSIDAVTGNLVLFPASLMHYTIPFKSEEERIVLAFDVISK